MFERLSELSAKARKQRAVKDAADAARRRGEDEKVDVPLRKLINDLVNAKVAFHASVELWKKDRMTLCLHHSPKDGVFLQRYSQHGVETWEIFRQHRDTRREVLDAFPRLVAALEEAGEKEVALGELF